MNPIVTYTDRESKDHIKTFSNTVILTRTPQGEIVLSFCEENIVPNLISKQEIGDNGATQLMFEPDDIRVNREFKCAVTLNGQVALDLAHRIISNFSEGK